MISDLLTHDVQATILQAAMIRNPRIISRDTKVLEAIALMSETGAKCLVVAENERSHPQKNSLIGILVPSEIAHITPQSTPFNELPVHAIIHHSVITLPESALTKICPVFNLFQQHDIRYLAILDDQDCLVGLLDKDALTQHLGQKILQLEAASAIAETADSQQEYSRSSVESSNVEETLNRKTKLFEEEYKKYQELFEFAPDGYLITHPSGVIQLANRTIADQLAVAPLELIGVPLVRFIHKQDQSLVYTRINQLLRYNQKQTWEVSLHPQQGNPLPAEVTVVPIGNESEEVVGLRWLIRDISERKRHEKEHHQAELLMEIQRVILEKIAKGDPLLKILEMLIQSMETQLDNAPCSILLCDGKGNLQHGAAPHLPAAFLEAIDRIPIGENVGSCGTAAFRAQTVVVSDIANDPLWQDYKALPLSNGLQACWSVPIIASDHQVLGTFAVYHYEPFTPNQQELSVAVLAANIAGIAIEREKATQALERLNQELEQRVQERTAALQASEERWQLVLKGTNDGIWDWDLKNNKIFFSSRWKQMRGFADHEIGDSPDECLRRIHPEDYDRVMAAVEDHFAGKTEFFEIEYRAARKDSSYMWVLERAQALRDESGQVIRMSGSESDINQRKETEQVLKRYERIISTNEDVIALIDRNYKYQVVNQAFQNDWGKRHGDIVGYSVAEVLGQELFENVLKANLDDVFTGQTIHHEMYLTQDSQSPRWMSVTCSPYVEADQTITGAVITARNITNLKKIETELRESERRYATLAAAAPVAIFRFDSPFNCVYVNDRWSEMTGRPKESALGKGWMDAIHSDDLNRLMAQHAENYTQPFLKPNQLINQGEGRHIHPDGSIHWFYVQVASEVDPEGNVTGFIGTLTDMTHQKQVENALYESQQFLQTVLDSFPLSVFWKDRNSVYLGANRNFLKDANLKSGPELIGKTDYDMPWGQTEAEAYRADDQQVMQNNTAQLGIIEPQIQADGQQIWLETNKIPLHDLRDEVIGVLGTYQDITDRRQAEVNLQESEIRFRRVFDSNVVGMMFANFQGHVTNANDRFLQMIGYTREELEAGAIRWDLMTPPEHVAADFKAIDCLSQNGMIEPWEKEYYRKDGSRVPVLVGAALLPGSGDQTICVIVDISDRKQTELALQKSQRFIQQIADASPNILYLYDLQEHRNIYANREIGTILGYSPEEIKDMGSKLIPALMHPDDQRTVWPIYVDRITSALDGEIVEHEYRMRHATGEWRWLYSRDSVFSRDAEGQARLVIGTAQDVSDRKRLQQEQNRLITLLEASTDYILIADVTGTPIWNNAALKQLRGLSDAEVPQQNPADYHPQWSVEMLQQLAIPNAIANGSWLGENILLDAEGREIPVSQLLLAHTSPQGEVEFFSTIMRDMRVHKEYEQRLEYTNAALLRATRLKDEFLANMSHELRTPLNAILGMTEGLQEQVFGPMNEKQLKALQTIDRSGYHLLELINDILDVAKIEAGQIDLNYTATSIRTLCQSSLVFIKQQAHQKNIQLEIQLPPHLPTLIVDERRIRQVLINLLNNAIKFTSEGGQITLKVDEHEEQETENATTWIRFSVIDTGIGIAPENLSKLFQPFIQIDSSLNRQYAGTGLGLALVKRLVELHGGCVGVSSELGSGSCFTVALPCVPDTSILLPQNNELFAAPTFETTAIEEETQHPLILLAEDNEANISTVSSYLEAKGYRILLARHGQAAIDLAKTHQPDLILMDIQMPGMDGLEAIHQIRAYPDLATVPIIALTALAMTGDREHCLEAGANDYLTKPIKLKQLVTIIQQHLAAQKSDS